MKWTASNYRKKKSEQLLKQKPQWVDMPSGVKFYLRRVHSALATVIAGSLPSGLTEEAIREWKAKGVAGVEDSPSSVEVSLTPEQIEDGAREMNRLGSIIHSACCVVPFLSLQSAEQVEFSDDWKRQAIEGLKELDKDFNPEEFNPAEIVLDPRELHPDDAAFLFRWASGLVLDVSMRGGGVAQVDDLARFRKRPGKVSRSRSDSQPVRAAS